MIELTPESTLELNKGCLRESEPLGVLDESRLESALGNQYMGFLYGSDLQAAVSTFRSLVLNHPFRNGNKRTALLALLYFADDLGEKIVISHKELSDLIYRLASEGGSKISVNSLTNILFGKKLEESFIKFDRP